ncbi:hypothetical protein HQQ81_12535 [Microbacteriaceae bacterium VKM Ac-2854]|nr:hypothetical protein [Microbacteriaceae bacterium VKM Ac-2854]
MTDSTPEWGSADEPEWGEPLPSIVLPPRVAFNPAGLVAPARRPTARPDTRLLLQHARASGGLVVARGTELRRRMRPLEPAEPRHPYDVVSADRRGVAFAAPGVDARLELLWPQVTALGIGTVGIDVRRARAVMLQLAQGRKRLVVPLVVMQLRGGLIWDVADDASFLSAYRLLERMRG